jgi:hypothetical protein
MLMSLVRRRAADPSAMRAMLSGIPDASQPVVNR